MKKKIKKLILKLFRGDILGFTNKDDDLYEVEIVYKKNFLQQLKQEVKVKKVENSDCIY